jgi:hypothetical protein
MCRKYRDTAAIAVMNFSDALQEGSPLEMEAEAVVLIDSNDKAFGGGGTCVPEKIAYGQSISLPPSTFCLYYSQ